MILKIQGRPYTVYFVEADSKQLNNDYNGRIYYPEREIYIRNDLDHYEQLAILFHEVTHAIFYHAGMYIGTEGEAYPEENIAVLMGYAFSQFVLDNIHTITRYKLLPVTDSLLPETLLSRIK